MVSSLLWIVVSGCATAGVDVEIIVRDIVVMADAKMLDVRIIEIIAIQPKQL
jgi:hypothetical protein